MDDEEFDRIGLGLDRTLLQDARDNRNQDVTLVMLVLVKQGTEARIVHQNIDYGDDDARDRMSDMVLRANRFGLLADGERLELREVGLRGPDMLEHSKTRQETTT